MASIAVDAIVPDGQGGTTTIAGVLDGGTWTLSSVPVGRYTLRVVGAGYMPLMYLQVAGNHVDLGYDSALREGIQLPTSSTVATYELSGLSPWSSQDFLQRFAWAPGLYRPQARPPFAPGATSGTETEDFASVAATQQFYPLLGSTDRLYVAQFQAATGAGNVPYWRAVTAGSVTGIEMVDGAPVTIPVAMAAIPQDRSATIDWRTTEFEAHLAEAGAGVQAAPLPHVFTTYGDPAPATISTGSATPDSLTVRPPVGADVNLGTLTYGSYAPSTFGERSGATFRIRVFRALPGATGKRFILEIGRNDVVVPSPIVPVITPVRNVTIEGLDAFQPQAGVGPTPFISWTAPGVGTPESYLVELYALGVADGRTTSQEVLSVLAEDPGVRLPAGVLVPGTSYVFVVYAVSGRAEPASPFRYAGSSASAAFLSEVFTP